MLRAKIQEDLLLSLKSGDKARLETLRYAMSRIKNQEIEKKGELDDTETITVLKKLRRELQESIESFEKGSREDLASQSKAQFEIINSYLPAEMSDEELKQAVEEVIEKNRAVYESSPKALIGIAIGELKGKAEGQRIMKVLQSLQ